ncbi:MAG: IPTL-CTERM sorting domain-containing protein [Brevundimonas sp.]|uniref:IPTL-CTERM sorting domain-containing protein n=1 Tax=Brevundimonas sp. TaxID=1871086 RepID=UPI004034CAB9
MLRSFLAAIAVLFAMVAPAAAQGVDPSTISNPQVGVAYSQTFTAPFPAFSFSQSGTLPPGLTFTNNGMSATLAGTPTTAGPYIFTINSSGMVGMTPVTGSRTYNVTVQPAVSAVPTLSEWAMILFAIALAGGAALYIEQRRRLV